MSVTQGGYPDSYGEDEPIDAPPEYDPAVYSNVSIGGRRVTWRELAEHQERDIRRLRDFERMVLDLDRNEHGRHEGDADTGDPCGVSHGGPHKTGDVLGYSLGGRWRYVMPEQGRRHDPEAWKVDNL